MNSIITRFPGDLVTAPALYLKPAGVAGSRYDIGTSADEWNYLFHNIHDGVIGIPGKPLVNNWNDKVPVHPFNG